MPDFIVTLRRLSKQEILYNVRPVSEQGIEMTERTTKDTTSRDFEDSRRLYEFFEKLSKRMPNKQVGIGTVLPWSWS